MQQSIHDYHRLCKSLLIVRQVANGPPDGVSSTEDTAYILKAEIEIAHGWQFNLLWSIISSLSGMQKLHTNLGEGRLT